MGLLLLADLVCRSGESKTRKVKRLANKAEGLINTCTLKCAVSETAATLYLMQYGIMLYMGKCLQFSFLMTSNIQRRGGYSASKPQVKEKASCSFKVNGTLSKEILEYSRNGMKHVVQNRGGRFKV